MNSVKGNFDRQRIGGCVARLEDTEPLSCRESLHRTVDRGVRGREGRARRRVKTLTTTKSRPRYL